MHFLEELEPRLLLSADALSESSELLTAFHKNPSAPAVVWLVEPTVSAGTVTQVQSQTEVVIIDAGIADSQLLKEDLAQQARAGRHIEWIELSSGSDGVAQISQLLKDRTDIAALHLVSHGQDGAFSMGGIVLDMEALVAKASQIKGWGTALVEGADIYLYGCDVAATDDGKAFVRALSALTGVDVAASDDRTGASVSGGDWILEYNTGVADGPGAFSTSLQEAWDHTLAIAANGTVTSASTSGATSLSWSHTVASGSNRVLFVQLAVDGLGASVNSVTYGGVNLTQVGRVTGNHAIEIWRLVNPTQGTANVDVTFGGTTAAKGGASTFNGVDQTTPNGAMSGSAGTGTSSSVTIASATGELVLAVENWDNNPTGYTTGAGQTQLWAQTDVNHRGVASTEAGAAFVTMSSTVSSSQQWEIGAISIKAAANVAPTISDLSGDAFTYTEDSGAVVIDQGTAASVTDSDSPDFDTGTLTVSIPFGGVPSEDVLGIRNQGSGAGQIGAASGTLTYGGTTIGTYTGGGGGSDLVITFNSNATTTAVSALINNITYEDTNTGTPSEGPLTVRFVLTDGDGGTSSVYDTGVTVVAVNDAPAVGTNTGVTVAEGSTGTLLTSAMLNEGDPDDSGAGLTYTLTSAPSSGTLKKSGVALTAGGSFTQDDIDANLITYDHNGSEASSDSFDFSLADGGENSVSPATGTFTITVTAVNDSPTVATNTGVTVAEGSIGTTISSAMLNEGDPDDAGTGLTYTLTSAPVNGTLKKSGVALSAGDSFTQADIISNLITYDHDGSETSSDSFGFSLVDGGEDGASPATSTFSITVTAVNDVAPVLTSGLTATVAENQTAVMTLTATDADLPGGTLTFTIVGGVDAAAFTLNPITGVLTFSTTPNWEAPTDAGSDNQYDIDVQVSDGLNFTAQSLQVSVTDVNESPMLGANSLSIAQGESTVLGSAQLSATDPESAPGTLTFSISSLSNGQFELVAAPGIAIVSFSQAQLSAGQVRFVHDGSASAPAYAVSVDDGLNSSTPIQVSVSFTSAGDAGSDLESLPIAQLRPDSSNIETPEASTTTSPATTDTTSEAVQSAGTVSMAAMIDGTQGIPATDASSDEATLSTRMDVQVIRPAERKAPAWVLQPPRTTSPETGPGPMQGDSWAWSTTFRRDAAQLPSSQAIEFELRGSGSQRAEEELTLGGLPSQYLLGGLIAGVGTAWWAGRAGILLASVAAGTPAWARLDPLPIADPRGSDHEQEFESGEHEGHPPATPPNQSASQTT